MSGFRPLIAPLFVPATRPDRIAKAARSNADAIIVDLEDAVPAPEKISAREGLGAFLADVPVPVFVRVNAVDSEWFAGDMAFARNVNVAGVMLPKTQSSDDIAAVGPGIAVIGLVETALGVASLSNICKAANLRQLAFGSIDYALDVGCLEERDALLMARLSIVTQSRAHNLAAPLDGVTVSVSDEAIIQSDADYAVRLGFGGKLTIHPKQVDIVTAAMRPSADDLDWARSVCAADDASGGAAVLVDGRMIDAPVIKRARRILLRIGTP
jgi:citrate lyase subunit beta/citryl-CoA lyase